uniref:Transmembrane protein n=1 Tax=Heterorhabditis bacteriophora TaxID=37862 RepID=A0A1I7X2R7_HETBA
MESVLEALKSSDKESTEQPCTSPPSNAKPEQTSSACISLPPVAKEHADHVVGMLLKFAVQTNFYVFYLIVLALVSVMPKTLLLQTVRPIQRAIISCLNSNHSSIGISFVLVYLKIFRSIFRSWKKPLESILRMFLKEWIQTEKKACV